MRKISGYFPLRLLIVAAIATTCCPSPVAADMVTIHPIKDTTIFVDPLGAQADGAGPHLRVGRSGELGATTNIRRALVEFDIAGSIPAGSTITDVTLTLFRSNVGSFFNNETIALYRLSADWGEGGSISIGSRPAGQGAGGVATVGDATWTQRFAGSSPEQRWTTNGGDFLPASSTSRTVTRSPSGVAPFVWPSTPTFVTDVQSFLDNAETNFGWIIRGDEATSRAAARFASRNNTNPAHFPLLSVVYTPPPDPRLVGDLDDDGDVDRGDMALLAQQFGRIGTGSTPFDMGDFNKDNTVSLADLGLTQQNLGQELEEVRAVPEPQAWTLVAMFLAPALVQWVLVARGKRRRKHITPPVSLAVAA